MDVMAYTSYLVGGFALGLTVWTISYGLNRVWLGFKSWIS